MNRNDGILLEKLIERVEKISLPDGFTVTPRVKAFSDSGTQIAEFDVIVSGKIGVTDFNWLLECRDRPAEGAAPGSWIEQLVGRRDRFNFNKVIAVSTTGFSEGAIEFANSKGIELREVQHAGTLDKLDWLRVSNVININRQNVLKGVGFITHASVPMDVQLELLRSHSNLLGNYPVLRAVKTGQLYSLSEVFGSVVSNCTELQQSLPDSDSEFPVNIRVNISSDEDYFTMDIGSSEVRIIGLDFRGIVVTKKTFIPWLSGDTIVQNGQSGFITQIARYSPLLINGHPYQLELYLSGHDNQLTLVLQK